MNFFPYIHSQQCHLGRTYILIQSFFLYYSHMASVFQVYFDEAPPSVSNFWACSSQHAHVCVCARSPQSCLTLWPYGHSPPGSSVHGILQAWILEWVAMLSSRGLSWPRDQTCVSYISSTGRQFLYFLFFSATWNPPTYTHLLCNDICTTALMYYKIKHI